MASDIWANILHKKLTSYALGGKRLSEAHGRVRLGESTNPTAALRHDQVLYYRSATRAEIDFVSAEFGGVCFESKYADRGWGRAFQTIESSPYHRGLVATRSGLQGNDNGWAVPAGLLALMLGS
jgi:hypothetical protein